MSAPLRLHDRAPVVPPADRGSIITAAQVATDIWQGKYSAKWVGQKMGPAIGFKLGKEWNFYEDEARQWKHDYIERQRRVHK
jgi:hypothetical protein